jgi:putative acetyltransferase
MVMRVREGHPADAAAVRAVVSAAFDDITVADLWDELAARPRYVSYVAESDGDLVGHVGLSWGWVDTRERLVDVLVLSPLSVAPHRQRRGVGRALVARAVEAADRLGSPVLFLEGDPRYYSRLGLVEASPHGFTPPSVRIPLPAFQCVLLSAYDPSVVGALVYPEAFWAHDSVGLRGELLEHFDI